MNEKITKILEAFNAGVITQEEATKKLLVFQEEYTPDGASKKKIDEMKENWDEDYFKKIEAIALDEKSKMNPKVQREYQAYYEELKKYRPANLKESFIYDTLKEKQEKIMESYQMGIINAKEGMQLIERVMMEADMAEGTDSMGAESYPDQGAMTDDIKESADDTEGTEDVTTTDISVDDNGDVSETTTDDTIATPAETNNDINALAEYINSLDEATKSALMANINITSADSTDGAVPNEDVPTEGEEATTEGDITTTPEDTSLTTDTASADTATDVTPAEAPTENLAEYATMDLDDIEV